MPNIYGYVFAFHLSVKLPRLLYINFTCLKLYEMWWLIGSLPDCCIGPTVQGFESHYKNISGYLFSNLM